MRSDLRKWLVIAFGVFVVAVAVSFATDGTISDIGFFLYAAAFIATIVLLALVIADYFRARGRGSV